MNANDDSDRALLQRLRVRQDAAAVAEVVRRYAGLVYGAAVRRVEAPAAGDVCVGVFTELIRHPAQVVGALPVWLHAAVLARTSTEGGVVPPGAAAMSAAWAVVAPQLDPALGRLVPLDRWHILVHFCALPPRGHADSQRGEFTEALAAGSAAAMRRLAAELHAQGVTLGEVELAATIDAHAIEMPPTPLASRLGQLALAALPTTSAVTENSALGRARLYLQLTIAVLVVVVVLGVVVYALSAKTAATAERRAQPTSSGVLFSPRTQVIRPA